MRRWLTIALVVALLASGIGNLMFYFVLAPALQDQAQARQAEGDRVQIVVAAANLKSNQEIAAADLKTVEVSKDYRNRILHSGKKLLYGAQPVGRITKVAIFAEEPFYDEDLLPFGFDESVSKQLNPGMRALVVEVSSKQAIANQGEYVDVLCTLKEQPGAASGGPSRIAVIAHGLRVVGPPNPIRSGAQPPPGETRAYTLEAAPYRNALIELARQRGGIFTLCVCPVVIEADRAIPPPVDDDPNTDLVTEADLERAFTPKGKPGIPPDRIP